MADPTTALVGSGEFMPVMAPVDALLLEGRVRRVAVIPTAAPSAAKRCAIPAPIPRLAPVTSTTRPSRAPGISGPDARSVMKC